MKKIKSWIRNSLSFSEREANGFIVLMGIIIILLLVPLAYPYIFQEDIYDPEKDEIIMQEMLTQIEANHQSAKQYYSDTLKRIPGPFDPNALSKDEWVTIGVREKTAQTIQNYLAKGGTFRKKKDLLKIYGFDKELYEELEPYIVIPKGKSETFIYRNVPVRPEEKVMDLVTDTISFDLNKANADDFRKIRGIGEVLSERIVKFRDKLGGFVNTGQLREVYNLPDSVAVILTERSFITKDFQPAKISINSATQEELSLHPYISWKDAEKIISYRKQHGAFHAAEDLTKIISLDKQLPERIKSYIVF